MTPSQTLGFNDIEQFVTGLLGTDMHAKRILSLVNATLGVVRGPAPSRCMPSARDWRPRAG